MAGFQYTDWQLKTVLGGNITLLWVAGFVIFSNNRNCDISPLMIHAIRKRNPLVVDESQFLMCILAMTVLLRVCPVVSSLCSAGEHISV
jgi:hypothetical protein